MAYQLPSLPYSYDALEPHIDTQTMRLHHTKHHQAYVDKLNQALKTYPDLQKLSLDDLLSRLNSLSPEIQTAIRNHGGGHFNHSFFWQIMTPKPQKLQNNLATAIDREFDNFAKFQEEFNQKAASHFGSGWTWLVLSQGKLQIITTPNQNTPVSQGQTPLLGLDLWEHAYYLKYQNRRSEYIAAFWNIVNWDQVTRHFTSAS